jgi:hypothetical protein
MTPERGDNLPQPRPKPSLAKEAPNPTKPPLQDSSYGYGAIGFVGRLYMTSMIG